MRWKKKNETPFKRATTKTGSSAFWVTAHFQPPWLKPLFLLLSTNQDSVDKQSVPEGIISMSGGRLQNALKLVCHPLYKVFCEQWIWNVLHGGFQSCSIDRAHTPAVEVNALGHTGGDQRGGSVNSKVPGLMRSISQALQGPALQAAGYSAERTYTQLKPVFGASFHTQETSCEPTHWLRLCKGSPG